MSKVLPVTSERLCLRRLHASDFDNFLAYRTDPLVARYQGWEPISGHDAIAFLKRAETAEIFRPGLWFQLGLVFKESDELIGDIGICLDSNTSFVEIGFSVNRQFQGQGYGSEGIRLAIELVFASTSVAHIIAETDARNLPAQKLLVGLQMVHAHTMRQEFKGEVCNEHVYILARPPAV